MRRCPLWDEDLGITPVRVIAYDLLHTMHLGIMQVFAQFALWQVLKSGIWGSLESNQAERERVAIMHLRHELFSWYKEFKAERLTRLCDLTPSMLGTAASPKLKSKGAETYGLLLYLLFALDRHSVALGTYAAPLLAAGTALKKYLACCRKSGAQMSVAAEQEIGLT